MIQHQVSLARPERRAVQVTLRADLPRGTEEQLLAFPVWTPGSYLVREHQRHVNDLVAKVDGQPVALRKVDKHRFAITTGGGKKLEVSWEFAAHELTVRTSHVDATHAFVNPVNCCAWLPGREHEPQQLDVTDLPAGWGVACGLAPVSSRGDRVRFRADDFDHLADSPFEAGPHAAKKALLHFKVDGKPHEVVLWGRSNLDKEKLVADLTKIVKAQSKFFGGLPYERYLFMVLLTDSGRGGLEHRASTALLFSRALLNKPKGYEDLLLLASHELFHAWNVKRIKPAAFTPYDYTRENHTRLLWAFEGFTSYYEELLALRAGVIKEERFHELVGEALTALARVPGRLRQPVAESSFDAWIRLYRADENTDNTTVSYYLKGQLVALLADLELRQRSNGKKSLDDVMRLLWNEYGRVGRGVPEDGVLEAIERIGGASARALVDAAVHGTGELPLAERLRAHGLKLTARPPSGSDDKGGDKPSGTPVKCDVGLVVRGERDRVKVAQVVRDGPAERAGLCPGDELVALDDLRLETGSAFARLHEREPGTRLRLTYFRRDELCTTALVAAPPVPTSVFVAPDPKASPAAVARRAAWLAGR